MRIIRFLMTPIVSAAFLINSISAKMIALLVVNLLGKHPNKKSKVTNKKKI